jgi:hypothetical protein
MIKRIFEDFLWTIFITGVALGFFTCYVAHAETLSARDAAVLTCRASENERTIAGLCGTHGCDCGILTSECAASREFLNSISDHESAAYRREAAAYAEACK